MQVLRVIILSSVLGACGVGCQNTYNQTTSEIGAQDAPLRGSSRVYVAMPEDAIDKKLTATGSGKRTALAIQDAFKRQTKNVLTGRVPETLPEAIAHARDLSYEYVAFPTIVKWQDRATEWNGVRDKLELKIDVVSVERGELVRSTSVDAKGKWMTDGDAAPHDLLNEPIDKFVRSLFRRTYTPTALQRAPAR